MGLDKQVFCYAVGTDAFYFPEEKEVHSRLLRLYSARKRLKESKKIDKAVVKWRLSALNRIIKKEKEKLTELLDKNTEERRTRELGSSAIIDKNVISLFESSLTRAMQIKTNELTDNIFVVNVFFFQVFENLVKDGFVYRGEKYVFLTASAGQIRQKKAVFVKESMYEKIQMRLMCGLTIDRINEWGGMSTNKFLAYCALSNSATDVWKDFDIDKTIVVDDFETMVTDVVDYINEETIEITRQKMPIPIPHMDGCGIMLKQKTRMLRLPWVKGLLIRFPFDEFIREKCPNSKAIVEDIYGKKHDILEEGIEYILTKSQFKAWKYYNDWEEYKTYFKEYGCEACYCNMEENDIPNARINYQMLQTLTDMTNEEIDDLVVNTNNEIEQIGVDYRTTMKLLGATEKNKEPNYFQQALMFYPELFRDSYSKEILKQTKKSLIKQGKAGRVRVNGGYRFISPDLYSFCEWLFLGVEVPKGLLANGEVYCHAFSNGEELACLRSPHLYREWAIRKNVRNDETDYWFRDTECIYTSTFDTISRILQFD